MRTMILALTVLLGTFAVATSPAGHAVGAETNLAALQAQPPQPAPVDVDIEMRETRAWYASPVWVAIGAIALVVLILLVVMAARGGGTTVIRD